MRARSDEVGAAWATGATATPSAVATVAAMPADRHLRA
jgi:hypothetical protein